MSALGHKRTFYDHPQNVRYWGVTRLDGVTRCAGGVVDKSG
jgi:hypothetical protein